MKKLLLISILSYCSSVAANYIKQFVGFDECSGMVFDENEVKSLMPDNAPCVYGTETIVEWTDEIVYVDNKDDTGATPMQVDPSSVPVGKKCLSCDYEDDILIHPQTKADGTSLDEEICPQRELLPSEKCSVLRISKLKEQK